MYAVIFQAEIARLDQRYFDTVKRLRQLAMDQYGCLDFLSVAEGNTEITISYWESQEQIRHWKQNADHLWAQEAGKTQWYKSYRVQVVEIVRQYGHNF